MTEFPKTSDNKLSFYLAVGKLLALIANFVIPIFLTRVLDKNDYGFYSQFNTVLFFLTGFFSFNMTTNLYFFFPTVKIDEKRIVIFQTAVFLLICSLLSILFIFMPIVNEYILGSENLQEFKFTIYILTIIIVFTGIIHPLMVLKKDIGTSIWFPVFEIVLKSVLIILFFSINPKIESVIYAIIVAAVLVSFIAFNYLRKSINELPGKRLINKNIARNQLIYNIPIGIGLSLKIFLQRFDKLISISFLSASSYASYSIAFFGVPGIQQIYQSIADVTVINMTKSFNNGKTDEALSQYKNMVRKTLSFSIPILIIVALHAREILIFLFTKKYEDATLLFQMYLISVLFVMLGEGLIIRASGNTKIYKNAFIILLPLMLPVIYFLVKYFDSLGAMCGALLSIILPRIYLMRKEIRILESNLREFLPWKEIFSILTLSLFSIIPFYFIKNLLPASILFIIMNIITYLSFVFLMELKLNIFIITSEQVRQLRKKYFSF